MDNDKKDAIKALGFSDIESKLYFALAENGACTAGQLARKSGVYRTNVYDALRSLVAQGLASRVLRGKKSVFSPTDASCFRQLVKRRVNETSATAESIAEMLEAIKPDVEENVLVFEGMDGARALGEEWLKRFKPGYEWVYLNATGQKVDNMLSPPFYARLKRVIKKTSVKTRIIFADNEQGRTEAFSPLYFGNYENSCKRFLPASFASSIGMHAMGDWSIVKVYTRGGIHVLTQSKNVADGVRSHFEALWKIARRIRN